MTINRARKLTIGFYTAAVVLLVVRLLFPVSGLFVQMMTAGFFGCILVGFVICYLYCRCPHCHRVIKAGFREITQCPFCSAAIHRDSRGV